MVASRHDDLALGVLLAWVNSTPVFSIPLGVDASDGVTLASWAISTLLNTTLTCMICYRVVRHGKLIREHLGNEHASLYFTVVTVVVESVLPYTLSSIAFLVSMGSGSATFVGFVCVYFLMMVRGSSSSSAFNTGLSKCIVYIAADVDPPSGFGDSMEQRDIQQTRLDS